MPLWPSSWLEDGSCTSESFFWLMQVWAGSVVFCKRTCCPVVHPTDIAEGRCSSPASPTPRCLAWSGKRLFSIYSSTAEVEHSLWWNGTSPSGPEKLACHTEIVMTGTFLGKACFVISPFYSQKKLFYQPANPQVSILASSSQTGETRYHKLTWNQWQSWA